MKRIGVLLVLAALVGCGKDTPADVKVEVAAFPDAEVDLNGRPVGTTPLTIEVPPGDHDLLFRREGFKDLQRKLRVEPGGEKQTVEALMVIADPDDDAALQLLAQADGFERDPLGEKIEVHRGGGSSGIVLYWPKGEVRIGSLSTYRLDVDVDYEGDGTLVFKKGSKVLHEQEFDPDDMATVGKLPAAVLEEVKANSVITWGVTFEDRRRKPVTCQFKAIGGDRVEQSLRKLQQSRNFQRQPEVVREIMRADLLRNKGLHSEALLHYLAVAQEWPDSTLPFKGIAASARRLDLQDTTLFADAARLSATKRREGGGPEARPGSFSARTGLPESLKSPSLGEVRQGDAAPERAPEDED